MGIVLGGIGDNSAYPGTDPAEITYSGREIGDSAAENSKGSNM